MRLINAEHLEKFIDYGHLNNPNEKLYSENDIREMIDMMPTVDAVPVIRCKDCKWFVDEEDQSYCIEMYGQCSGNGFCAWAERKEE